MELIFDTALQYNSHNLVTYFCNMNYDVANINFVNYILENNDIGKLEYLIDQIHNISPHLINKIYFEASENANLNNFVRRLAEENIVINITYYQYWGIISTAIGNYNYELIALILENCHIQLDSRSVSKLCEDLARSDNVDILILFLNSDIDIKLSDVMMKARKHNSQNIINYISNHENYKLKNKILSYYTENVKFGVGVIMLGGFIIVPIALMVYLLEFN